MAKQIETGTFDSLFDATLCTVYHMVAANRALNLPLHHSWRSFLKKDYFR